MTLFNTIIMRAMIRLGQVVWLVGIIEIAIEIENNDTWTK